MRGAELPPRAPSRFSEKHPGEEEVVVIEPERGAIFQRSPGTILEEEEHQDRCEELGPVLACSPFLPTSSETLQSALHLASSSTLNSASTLQGKIIASLPPKNYPEPRRVLRNPHHQPR